MIIRDDKYKHYSIAFAPEGIIFSGINDLMPTRDEVEKLRLACEKYLDELTDAEIEEMNEAREEAREGGGKI